MIEWDDGREDAAAADSIRRDAERRERYASRFDWRDPDHPYAGLVDDADTEEHAE